MTTTKIKCDMLGNFPKIGDTIAFNPPKFKGLITGKIIGFTSTGSPKLQISKEHAETNWKLKYAIISNMKLYGAEFYTPRTNWVIAKTGTDSKVSEQ